MGAAHKFAITASLHLCGHMDTSMDWIIGRVNKNWNFLDLLPA